MKECKSEEHVGERLLNESEFRRDSRLSSGYQSSCKKCVSARIKAAYPDKYRTKRRKRAQEYRERNKQMLAEYVQGKQCLCCGEDDPVVFDFHHTDPSNKKDTVANLSASGISWDIVLTEIKKCDILCANCHRKEHHRLRK